MPIIAALHRNPSSIINIGLSHRFSDLLEVGVRHFSAAGADRLYVGKTH
jgi:hypothetical protein